jgi:hypothetical protein
MMSVGLTGSIGYVVNPTTVNAAAVAGSSVAAAAGSSLAQASGPDTTLAHQDVFVQQRGIESAQQAEDAQGIGLTDGEDNQTNERDADGRTPWMLGARHPAPAADETADDSTAAAEPSDSSDDPGSHLDLSG